MSKRDEALIQRIIDEMECSIFNEEGTIDTIVIEALKEIDNLKDCTVSDYEWKAYTLNIIRQCQNFIKTTKINTHPQLSDDVERSLSRMSKVHKGSYAKGLNYVEWDFKLFDKDVYTITQYIQAQALEIRKYKSGYNDMFDINLEYEITLNDILIELDAKTSFIYKWQYYEKDNQKGFITKGYNGNIDLYIGIDKHTDNPNYIVRCNCVLDVDLHIKCIKYLREMI